MAKASLARRGGGEIDGWRVVGGWEEGEAEGRIGKKRYWGNGWEEGEGEACEER